MVIVHRQNKTAKPRLGRCIRRRRKALKLSLREVCRRAKIEPAALSRIENEDTLPNMNTIVKIAQVLELDINKLIRFTTHDTNLKKKGPSK